MNIVHKEDLKNLCLQEDFQGSEANFYTCLFDNKHYIYKEPIYTINKDSLKLYQKLESINETSLLIPKIFVFKNRIIGHLTEQLFNYSLLYDLKNNTIDKKIQILKLVKEKIVKMHELGIIHCDLHIYNVMYNNENIKIIDFENCSYKDIIPIYFSHYSKNYLRNNPLSPSVDIYNFNIDTASILYNVSWPDIFKFSFTFEDKLTPRQKEIWVKTKEKKELTSNDYLIDYY